jgi:hypothetical protein
MFSADELPVSTIMMIKYLGIWRCHQIMQWIIIMLAKKMFLAEKQWTHSCGDAKRDETLHEWLRAAVNGSNRRVVDYIVDLWRKSTLLTTSNNECVFPFCANCCSHIRDPSNRRGGAGRSMKKAFGAFVIWPTRESERSSIHSFAASVIDKNQGLNSVAIPFPENVWCVQPLKFTDRSRRSLWRYNQSSHMAILNTNFNWKIRHLKWQ